jgi:hypothetical protein
MLFSAFFLNKSMFHNSTFAAAISSAFLLVYCIMLHVPPLLPYAEILMAFSPLLIVWMVFVIMKDAGLEGPGLNGEEFGYGDKDKNKLGIF